MPATININLETECPVVFDMKKFIKKILTLLKIKTGDFSFTFVQNAQIVQINQQFLKRDYATDIISFNLGTVEDIEGDVYISVEQAAINATGLGHGLDLEIKTLLVHGILHLLDYQDYTEEERSAMFAEQDRLLALAQ